MIRDCYLIPTHEHVGQITGAGEIVMGMSFQTGQEAKVKSVLDPSPYILWKGIGQSLH